MFKNRLNYNEIAGEYAKTREKPDKKFSMLPTALDIVGSLENKIVVDVGCGDGFFTREFAKRARGVVGVDNSTEQIRRAKIDPIENVEYVLANMLDYDYSSSDIVFSPFVLNYLSSAELPSLFSKFYDGLNHEGVLAGVVDMPKYKIHDMKKYGSVKKISRLEDDEEITIELYDKDIHLTTLTSIFHTKGMIEAMLTEAGFSDVRWHDPLISENGYRAMCENFWEGYVENCDLAYFTAKKT